MMEFEVSFTQQLCPTTISELKEDEMEKLFWTTGQMRELYLLPPAKKV